jgi:type I restriction enzyme, R subunit
MEYAAYRAEIVALTRQVRRPENRTLYPSRIDSPVRRALYDNLPALVGDDILHLNRATYAGIPNQDAIAWLAVEIDNAIREVKKADWRGHRVKRLEVRNAIKSVLGDKNDLVDAVYKIVDAQHGY